MLSLGTALPQFINHLSGHIWIMETWVYESLTNLTVRTFAKELNACSVMLLLQQLEH